MDEKAQEAADKNDPELRRKGKQILSSYIGKFKGLIMLGMFTNILGLFEDLTFPLFIGWFLDSIAAGDFE